MRALRAAFGVAPKAQDVEYESRKETLGELVDALHAYRSAMEKIKTNIKVATQSLNKARAAFEQMVEPAEVSNSTRSLIDMLGTAVDRITGQYLAEFVKTMDADVIPAALDLDKLADECHVYQSARNKALREYNSYRNAVSDKEEEYARKHKDLSQSRGYNADVVKRDELKEKFMNADRKFKDCHEFIGQNLGVVVSQCLGNFSHCIAGLASNVAQEFETIASRIKGSNSETPRSSEVSGGDSGFEDE